MIMAPLFLLLALLLALTSVSSREVSVRNDQLRLDTDGNIIDCHSGNIVHVNGTFFMYGERYDNISGIGPSPPIMRPHIVVYTSPDLTTWTNRGEAFQTWPNFPYGTFFTPWGVYDDVHNRFVVWFNAYENGCCDGNWGVAVSDDGVSFEVLSMNTTGKYAEVDCNSILIDDDGTGYLLYTSIAENHLHSIEVLSDDYTTTIGVNFGLIGDDYTEGGSLFKHNGTFYFAAGSCSCMGRNGSGWVVRSSSSIQGPWTRQPLDTNCNSTVPGDVCGGYGERTGDPITVNAQGIGLSYIPLADGTQALLWQGDRWLSAPFNSPLCPDECRPQVAPDCAEDPRYVKGHMFDYWVALQFGADGAVQPFGHFVNNFTLDIAVSGGAPRDGSVAAEVAPPRQRKGSKAFWDAKYHYDKEEADRQRQGRKKAVSASAGEQLE
jgi:hypothetical protein